MAGLPTFSSPMFQPSAGFTPIAPAAPAVTPSAPVAPAPMQYSAGDLAAMDAKRAYDQGDYWGTAGNIGRSVVLNGLNEINSGVQPIVQGLSHFAGGLLGYNTGTPIQHPTAPQGMPDPNAVKAAPVAAGVPTGGGQDEASALAWMGRNAGMNEQQVNNLVQQHLVAKLTQAGALGQDPQAMAKQAAFQAHQAYWNNVARTQGAPLTPAQYKIMLQGLMEQAYPQSRTLDNAIANKAIEGGS